MSEAAEVKTASNVVTSENLAEWTANKLGLATEEAPVVADETVEETPVESEPIEAVESESEPKEVEQEANPTEERKQNPKLEKRFSELTKQREQLRKEAEAAKAEAERLKAEMESLRSGTQQPITQSTDEKPQPHQFQDAFEYAEALAEWSADQAVMRAKQEEQQRKQEEERQKLITSWQQRLESVKSELPDYDEMVASSDVVVSDEIRDAILESDVGPRILYELAQNDDLAKKITSSNLITALREIGKLEAKFEAKTEDKAESKPVVAKSKAPEPIKPLRATGGVADVKVDTNGQFHGTYAQWKEARRAGRIR